jgi:hypothetical protein
MNIRNDLATSKTTSTAEMKFASLLRSHIPPYNTTVASFYFRAKLHFRKYVNCSSKVSIAAKFVSASFHVFIACPVQITVFSLLTPSVSALRATSIFRTRSRLSPWQISPMNKYDNQTESLKKKLVWWPYIYFILQNVTTIKAAFFKIY